MNKEIVRRVIFIRPGETDWNRLGRWQGWTATPLSTHGRAQAEQLAKFVRHIGMKALYTSDLRRAIETARILADKLGFEPIPDARLRERGVGVWQGLTVPEMRAWFPNEYQKLLDDPEHFRMEGGESRADVRARMVEAFQAYLHEGRGETIGILSHTSAIRILLSEIIAGYDPYTSVIGNTSVTTIFREDENHPWQLVIENDLSHLEGLESQSVDEIDEVEEIVR